MTKQGAEAGSGKRKGVADKPSRSIAPGKDARREKAAKSVRDAEELRLRVSAAFRREFKQAARTLDLKKGAFLEKLFREWAERRGAAGAPATTGEESRRRRAGAQSGSRSAESR